MRILIRRTSKHTVYTDYRMGMNTFGAKQFATAYEIDEAVIVAHQITNDHYDARAIWEDGTCITESDIRATYRGIGNVETIIRSLYHL